MDKQYSEEIPESLLNASQAIALSYDGEKAPILAAKGNDELAQAIIQLALQAQVPIYENAELSQWLSKLELGDEIPQALYLTIAEILAFVYKLEDKEPQ
ncbi:MAG: EscU/YscU/HrcU family type III secretion system export apparatus switch protein [Oleispira sp.]|nr:EscU/YscU/HrcU family type III secretion system export apparatus switch protein [Oleispira sp.]MBL4880479.1 EscU/YscU/HrcU family type III secretion system export apparatus switch protein [Oleispira sp.]